jgi:hypothetical protein
MNGQESLPSYFIQEYRLLVPRQHGSHPLHTDSLTILTEPMDFGRGRRLTRWVYIPPWIGAIYSQQRWQRTFPLHEQQEIMIAALEKVLAPGTQV